MCNICFVKEHSESQARIKELEAKLLVLETKLKFPDPPTSPETISAVSVRSLIIPYGINVSGSMADSFYCLPTKDEVNRFLTWYKVAAPIKPSEYTQDDLDCDDFAWVMRAYFLIWSKGKYFFGYVEAEGLEEYTFPGHGFNFVILDDRTVWFADHLEVAAPAGELHEAYKVKGFMAKG